MLLKNMLEVVDKMENIGFSKDEIIEEVLSRFDLDYEIIEEIVNYNGK